MATRDPSGLYVMKGKRVWLEWLILGLFLLLGLCLRGYRLDGQSLWADEGNSAALAARSLATITRDAAHDIHPPLYYYCLHLWVRLWGNSEIALRSLSALAGTALVFATFLLGRELFPRRVAYVAALLAAISPFQVYYSQEARMYVLVALWSVLAVLFCVRWMRSWKETGSATRRRAMPSAVLYVCFTTAALYTHYFAFTVPLVTNLAYGLGMMACPSLRRLRKIGAWVGAQLVVAALYLPWLRLAGGQLTTWPAVSEPFSLRFLLEELLRVFSLGLSVERETTPVVLGFGLLLLLGALPLVLWSRRGRRPGLLGRSEMSALLFTLLYLGLPVLAMYLLSQSRPAYDPKFLLLVTPAFSLLLARGIAGEWLTTNVEGRARAVARWVMAGILLLFVLVASAASLRNYYDDERYARDDYRGMAGYISAAGQEGDAIILNAPGQIEIFSYYYRGDLPIYPLPGQRPLDEGKTEEALEEIVSQYRHLYALFWGTAESDPQRFIEGWLDEHTFKAQDSWHGNVRLVIYAVPEEGMGAEIQHPLDLRLGGEIALLGYSLADNQVRPGDVLQLTLFWEALGEIGERYKVFTHVLDGRSFIVGQRDAEPGGGARPTTIWQEGEIVADNYGVLVLPATPPGEFQLEIGMYSLETGERLGVTSDGETVGARVLLEPIEVLKAEAPPPIEALGIQYRREVDLGPVRLLGYNLSKLGFEHLPEEPVRPGDTLHLTFFWQATGEIDADFTLTLQLLDQAGNVVASREVKPTGGAYPPSTWQNGEIVRDQHSILLPETLVAGKYDLFLQTGGVEVSTVPLLLAILQF
jgi:mannosyltransferase